jgi:hypothetical protein
MSRSRHNGDDSICARSPRRGCMYVFLQATSESGGRDRAPCGRWRLPPPRSRSDDWHGGQPGPGPARSCHFFSIYGYSETTRSLLYAHFSYQPTFSRDGAKAARVSCYDGTYESGRAGIGRGLGSPERHRFVFRRRLPLYRSLWERYLLSSAPIGQEERQ